MSIREGLAFFVRRPRLLALAGVTGVSAVFGRNYGLTLAVLVTGPLAGGAGAFGTVSTVLAVGGILGAVLGARLRRPSVRLVGTLAATGALLQVVAGLSPSLAVLLVLVLPMAVVESVSDTAGTAVLQTDPPAHLRGRVLGIKDGGPFRDDHDEENVRQAALGEVLDLLTAYSHPGDADTYDVRDALR